MNEKTIKALVEAGAVKRIHIVADGSRFHVEAATPNGAITACTLKGTPKTWSTLDAAAKWVRGLGLGKMQVDISKWQPGQRGLQV